MQQYIYPFSIFFKNYFCVLSRNNNKKWKNAATLAVSGWLLLRKEKRNYAIKVIAFELTFMHAEVQPTNLAFILWFSYFQRSGILFWFYCESVKAIIKLRLLKSKKVDGCGCLFEFVASFRLCLWLIKFILLLRNRKKLIQTKKKRKQKTCLLCGWRM